MSKIISITTDEKTNNTISRIKKDMGGITTAEMLRRAIALLDIFSNNEAQGGKNIINFGTKNATIVLVNK